MPEVKDPILLLIVLDFLILLLCLIVLFDRRRAREPKDLDEIPDTVNRMVHDTEEFLTRAHGEMQEKRASFERMLQEIQGQGKHLGERITEAKHMLKQTGAMFNAPEPPTAARAERVNGGREPYEQALRMFEDGTPVAEISQKLNLTRSELEVVLGLQTARGASAAAKAGK